MLMILSMIYEQTAMTHSVIYATIGPVESRRFACRPLSTVPWINAELSTDELYLTMYEPK